MPASWQQSPLQSILIEAESPKDGGRRQDHQIHLKGSSRWLLLPRAYNGACAATQAIPNLALPTVNHLYLPGILCLSSMRRKNKKVLALCFFKKKKASRWISQLVHAKPREVPILPGPPNPWCCAQLWLLQDRLGQRAGVSDYLLSV